MQPKSHKMDTKKFPKVLQILPALNQGGVERATVDMANALINVHPKVPSFVASSGGDLKNLLNDKVIHVTLPLASKNPIIMLRNAWKLCNLIQKYHINIIHVRSRAPAWSALLAAKWTKIPFITTYHAAYKSQNILKKLYNSAMARGDVVITISKFIDTHVKGAYPFAKTHLIYEGIDTDFFSKKGHIPCVESPFLNAHSVLFMPSRQSPIKGGETLLRAMKTLSMPVNLILIEVGKADHIEYMKNLVRELDLEAHVHWIPPQRDLRPFYVLCDMVIVPSTVPEALGRVNIEAISMEKPLIASHLGANVESCIHGHTGFIFKAGDAKDLSEKITKTLSLSKEEQGVITAAGRTLTLNQFQSTRMIQETVRMYAEVHRAR